MRALDKLVKKMILDAVKSLLDMPARGEPAKRKYKRRKKNGKKAKGEK